MSNSDMNGASNPIELVHDETGTGEDITGNIAVMNNDYKVDEDKVSSGIKHLGIYPERRELVLLSSDEEMECHATDAKVIQKLMDKFQGQKSSNGNKGPQDNGDSKGFWSAAAPTQAKMSVHRDSHCYNMQHPKRGRAVIFNHEVFDKSLDLGRRHGTKRDKENLIKTLKAMDFEVSAYDDLRYQEMLTEIGKLTKEDHSDSDCLFIAVLSHGDTEIMYAKDYSYKPDMVWGSFSAERVPSLAGKPKLFFIQACRGSNLDVGTKLTKVSRTEVDSLPQSYRIPNHADFLVVFSTVPGYYSWRNTTHGSWFIQALCRVLWEYHRERDLLSLMTIVARDVAINFESNTPSQPHMHEKKQIPFITSTLIRDVYFHPKKQLK